MDAAECWAIVTDVVRGSFAYCDELNDPSGTWQRLVRWLTDEKMNDDDPGG